MASLAKLRKKAEEGDDAEAWYRFGVAAAAESKDEAILALRSALERDPSASLSAAIGQSLETLGDLLSAEHAYRRAVDLDGSLSEAHGFLGALLCRVGRKTAGLRALARWADLAENPAAAHVKLATLLLGQDDHASAANHLQIAVALDPKHKVALRLLGAEYERLGNREGCVRAWQSVHEIDPDDAYSAASYGAALSGAGRHTEAIEILSKVAERAPPFWELHLHLGRALREAGRPEQAVEHLALAARMAATAPLVHVEIGRVLEALARPDEAAASFRRAIDLDPKSAEAHLHLGLLLRALGRSVDAQKELEHAASLAPHDERIKRALAIGGIGGSLSVIALPDLLQFLNASRASGVLTIRGSEKVSIRFAQGNLQEISTPTGSYTDEAGMVSGLIEILRYRGEAFDFDHREPSNIGGVDPRFVLMEAMRRLDEEEPRSH